MTSTLLRFGVFELSPQTKELRRRGILLKLAPQPFCLLLYLVERQGQVVTREELQSALWGDTYVELDAGLNRCVRQIRNALNDDSEAPRYLETIPRVGYRFIAPIESIGAPQVQRAESMALTVETMAEAVPKTATELIAESRPISLSVIPVHVTETTSRSWVWRRKWIVAGAAVLLLAGGILLHEKLSKPQISEDLTTTPLTAAAGDHYSPTFSPDGEQVAFSWSGETDDNFDIYVKDVNSPGTPTRLTSSTAIDYSPAWSPSGEWIAFCRGGEPEGHGEIWLMRPLGRYLRKLIKVYSTAVPSHRAISWLPDSNSFITTLRVTQDGKGGIYKVDLANAHTSLLQKSKPGEEFMFPSVSPDGKTLAFIRDSGPGISTVMLLPLDGSGSTAREIAGASTFRHVLNRYPAWTPDGRSLVFSSEIGGRRHLLVAPVYGGNRIRELGELGDQLTGATISSKGALSFVQEQYDTNIWRLDLTQHPAAATQNPTRAVVSTRLDGDPALSPDGLRIAFSSNRSGFSEIWISRVDGAEAKPATDLHSTVTGSPSWSPDGKSIVFDSRFEGAPAVYSCDVDGGRPVKLSQTLPSAVVPRWSADGQWVYFSSLASGRMEVWRVGPSGGTPEQITKTGGFAGHSSPDGKLLYYLSNNEPFAPLWRLNIESGITTQIAPAVLNRGFGVSADGSLVFISASAKATEQAVWKLPRDARSPEHLLRLEQRLAPGASLSPNGDALYYTGVDRAGHELVLVNKFWR